MQKQASSHKWIQIQSISHITLGEKNLYLKYLINSGIREKTPQYPQGLWKPPHRWSSTDFPSEWKMFLFKSLFTTMTYLLGLFCINHYLFYKREMKANMNLQINKHKI